MTEEQRLEGGHIDSPLPEDVARRVRSHSDPIDTPYPVDGIAARPQPVAPEPRFWRVRLRANPYFMGRESTMVALHDAFQRHPVVQLLGHRGSGTTQTALAYAYRARPHFDAVFWIDGKDRTLARFDLARAGAGLDSHWNDEASLDDQLGAIKAWMKTHLRWLLIIDGVAAFEAIRDFLPEPPTGRVLLTSDVPLPEPEVAHLNHPPFVHASACLFLAHRSQQERDEHVAALVRLFDYATMPIFLAGAYCHLSGTTVQAYRSRLEATLSREDIPRSDTKFENNMLAAVALSLQYASEKDPAALELMALCAFLDTEDIALAMLCDGAPFLPRRLGACVSSPEALNATLTLLHRLALVQFEQNSLAVHPDVQAATRQLLGAEQGFAWLMTALRVVREAFPVESRYGQPIPACSMLLRHVFAVTARSEQSNQLREGTGLLLNHVGLYLHACKELNAARACFERSIQLAESLYGKVHPTIAARVNSLGVILQELKRYADARACYERAFDICEAVYGPARDAALGPAHRSMLTMPSRNLCQVLELMNDVPAAKAAYQRAVKVFMDVYCWNHSLVAESMNGLGNLFFRERNFSAAMGYFDKAIQAEENAEAPEPGNLGKFHRNLAQCFLEQDAFKQALEHFQQALHADRDDLGKMHKSVATDLIGVGKACRGLSRYDEAHVAFDDALTIYRTHSTAPTREQAQVWRQKGRAYMDAQEYDQAARSLQQSLALTRAAEGPTAIAQGPDYFYLGRSLARLDRLPEAENALRAALDLHLKQAWMDDETLTALFTRLGRILRDQRKIDQAIALFKNALVRERERHDAPHDNVGAGAYVLGSMYMAAYEYEPAMEYLQLARDIYQETRGPDDPRTRRAIERLDMLENLV